MTIVMAACNVHPQTSAKTTSIPVLKVSCEGQDDGLNCRALKQVAGSPVDARESVDVTDAVVWTTSNASDRRCRPWPCDVDGRTWQRHHHRDPACW